MSVALISPSSIKVGGKYIVHHPAAALFPMMKREQFDVLVADIRRQGQLEPVILYKGMVLDGRNRLRACEELDIEPRVVEWSEQGDPLDIVISLNLSRRHLTTSQRAMAAARLANMKVGDNRGITRPEHLGSLNLDSPEISLAQAAERFGVSRANVSHAKVVVLGGTPEEIAKVDNGTAVSTMATIIRDRQKDEGTRKPGPSNTRKPPPLPPASAEIVMLHPSRGKGKRTFNLGPKTPNGETPELIARRGLALRDKGVSINAIAAELKIASRAASDMMDVVLIADRNDLNEKETRAAKTALARLNDRTLPMESIMAMIEPIAERLWGDRKQSHKGRKAIEAERLDRFERAVNIMLQCCSNGLSIPIAHVPPKRREELSAAMKQARTDINIFIERLRSAHA